MYTTPLVVGASDGADWFLCKIYDQDILLCTSIGFGMYSHKETGIDTA